MGITWAAPGALWLLAALPLVWLGLRGSRTNFNPRQRRAQAGVRSLVLALIVLALARPVISFGSSQVSVVYLVDVSYSVSGRAIQNAAARIDALQAELKPAHSKILAFAGDVQAAESTAAIRAMADVERGPAAASALGRDRTNLEHALRAAHAELQPGYVPRIVLFSDGRASAGDTTGAVTELVRDGVPVFVEPAASRDLGDAWIDRVDVPTLAPPGGIATVAVTVGSQREGAAKLEIRDGSTVLASRDIALTKGETQVSLDVVVDQPGAHRLEAVLTSSGDPLSPNNTFNRELVVGPKPRVLYVEGETGSAHYLRDALVRSGLDVTATGASSLPPTTDQLQPFDVVIMSDIARSAIPDASMAALGDWVEHDGGGLLVAGGQSVFGEGREGGPGGYRHTEVERLSPVTFERKDEPEIALVIVLDKSWSMAGQQMELCKAAAQAAIDVLTDEQSVGVVTFNDEFHWDVPVRNVGRNRAAIRKAVSAIEPSGHTLIYPAIEQAFAALKEARARAKHVVLLSDGRSYPDDYEGLLKKMVDAKMTVSSIAVGAAADVELLTNIAKWGKGRSYVVEDAKEVPQIFVKEAKNAATPGFDEKVVKPVLKTTAFLDGVDMTKLPNLKGRTAVVLKDGALEVMATADGDPLLAFWPIGLGRTAVFASDVKDRWAADWLNWRGYSAFFASTVRALSRTQTGAATFDVFEGPERDGRRPIRLSLEVRDAKGRYDNAATPVFVVKSASGDAVEVTARQTAPGHYEASVTANAAEIVTIGLKNATPGGPTRMVIPDAAAEYRFRPPDEPFLRSLASATGGHWQATAAALGNTSGVHRAARRALWPWLVVAALLGWCVDILGRRVRVFEPA